MSRFARCLIVLLESGDGEPLFLQFKEAVASVLEPYTAPSEFDPGERVVVGQRITQTMGDIFLGWSQLEGSRSGRRCRYPRCAGGETVRRAGYCRRYLRGKTRSGAHWAAGL